MGRQDEKTILLVSGESDALQGQVRKLKEEGLQVLTARNENEAVEAALSLFGAPSDACRDVEAALRESEEMFRSITEQSCDFISLTDDSGVITYASPAAKSVFGRDPEDMRGRSFLEFVDEPVIGQAVEAFRETMQKDKRLVGLVIPLRKKDGTPLIGEVSGQHFKCESRDGTLVVIRDVTERIQAEDRIRSLLEEKELLLKEVNHRIKNNMITINSLLSLHAGNLKDADAADALEDAAGRVRSIMVLYEILYQSANFDKLTIKDYLNPLVNAIMSSFPNGGFVKVENILDDFVLDTARLQSVGIIVNELLTNCMKYAFRIGDEMRIGIFAFLRKGRIYFEIEDNGCGLPETVSFEHSTGFGLSLVGTLVKQLHGTAQILRGRGTKIAFDFEL